MADKRRDQLELERLQQRYVGTGSADTTALEWQSNIHRDTLACFIGHPPLLQYAAIGLGKTKEQTRVHLLERMLRPVEKKACEPAIPADVKAKWDAEKEAEKEAKKEAEAKFARAWQYHGQA